jgi:hypothetical protein
MEFDLLEIKCVEVIPETKGVYCKKPMVSIVYNEISFPILILFMNFYLFLSFVSDDFFKLNL